jgi:hypothetical protein
MKLLWYFVLITKLNELSCGTCEDKKNKDLKKYLKKSLEHMVAAGHGIKEFSEFTLEHLGNTAQPHIRDFIQDVHTGAIKVKGITKATRNKILGYHISKEEREQMIREAAYQLAEKRNFVGGDAETDWYEAEEMLICQLDEDAGLVVKSFKTVTHLSTELAAKVKTLEHDVHKWLDDRHSRAG